MGTAKNNGFCNICGNPAEIGFNLRYGQKQPYLRSVCTHCRHLIKRNSKGQGKYYVCSQCGWRGYCDLHHKDGNHSNNKPKNLVFLCPNCHRNYHSPLPIEIIQN